MCSLTYFLLCNLHPQLPFVDKKSYFQSWSDFRLHFTQKCVASNFPLLPQRPFYSSLLQFSPIESLEVFLRSHMTFLLLFFVRCTDRWSLCISLLFNFKFYFGLSCCFCVCQPFAFCCCDHFCLHIVTCACSCWRTSSFLDYCLQSVIFISLLSPTP